ISAPDTKALPPAPVTTTTRTALSAAKSARMPWAASHISSDTALCRSGLLKVIVPTPPSLRDSILSVCVIVKSLRCSADASHGFSFVQRRDFLVGESEFLEDLVGVFADVGRARRDLARRARQLERLTDEAEPAAVGARRFLRHAKMLDLRIGKHLIDIVDGSARHADFVKYLDPLRG